jgi:hypothetical protein
MDKWVAQAKVVTKTVRDRFCETEMVLLWKKILSKFEERGVLCGTKNQWGQKLVRNKPYKYYPRKL